ncbi:MAG: class I SAM-dependent methyltransferase [Chthoniobacteraceae bacterium]
MAIAYEPRRFKTTADYYVRGRLAYPDELIVRVVALTGITRDDRVLDLGCGPGFLAAAFAPYAREVVGMDPEPNMLAAARDYAARLGQKVRLMAGSSYDLTPALGSFRLVTMGRSFHWMDRAATLEKLAALTPERSAVALFHDSHCALPENAWQERYKAALAPYRAKDESVLQRESPDWLPHEAYLLASHFNRLERISVIRRIETPVDRLIDRALSMSVTSPEKLGENRKALVAKLRETLESDARNGIVTEIVESEALLGFRSPPV